MNRRRKVSRGLHRVEIKTKVEQIGRRMRRVGLWKRRRRTWESLKATKKK